MISKVVPTIVKILKHSVARHILSLGVSQSGQINFDTSKTVSIEAALVSAIILHKQPMHQQTAPTVFPFAKVHSSLRKLKEDSLASEAKTFEEANPKINNNSVTAAPSLHLMQTTQSSSPKCC